MITQPAPLTIGLDPPARTGRWWWLVAALPVGLALGIVARGWMYLIADEPEFTWSGTLFIVGAFGVAAVGRTLAECARRTQWKRMATTIARLVGAALIMPLFTAAGAMMLPTVALGAVARWRPLPQPARIVLGVLAAIPVGIISVTTVMKVGFNPRVVLGLVAFVGTYVIIIGALRPVAAPVQDGR